jgi:co-chaperonin GroES (HSP10)
MAKIILPARGYIILKTIQQTTPSGLEVPTTDESMPVVGTVYKIGEGKLPLPVVEGDILVFKKYLSNKVYLAEIGESLDFVRFVDIVAVIKEEDHKK